MAYPDPTPGNHALELISEAMEAEDGLDVVADSLAAATSVGDWLEIPDAAAALAAAELVAAARGAPSPVLPAEAVAWAARTPGLAALAPRARSACEAVRRGSELRERWEESGGVAAWDAAVAALARRLA
ncbi:DUF4259 domain-containing protein [Anaeromyxobacter oryzae]|uniref:DUF4259 domain-containing protein n=1 Tax=Anaeromyxobacter oryzae TaxID=2918170 RepID=A0ABN6MX05_9BACT|nr:DUF4259 domain-containing protein [Anaeromyxobacter oryzae]BDG05435.1 hypothetical protein AMOR_44310 [Anaeromyxobacter oryzae]